MLPDPSTDSVSEPTTDDRDQWQAYWQSMGQGWRTEPLIDVARQAFLNSCRTASSDCPFNNRILSRADVEWLLATHEGGGPVDWSIADERRRVGLDLRGANIRGVNLSGLPLARLRGGLTKQDRIDLHGATEDTLPTIHLEGANLAKAHLEGADLGRAHLEGANLWHAHLEEAMLGEVHLEAASLLGAYLTKADLMAGHLEAAYLVEAHLEGVTFVNAHLEGARLMTADATGAYFVQAHLAGADLRRTRLGRAWFYGAHLAGKTVPEGVFCQVHYACRGGFWCKNFPICLPPADLREAVLDDQTRLNEDAPDNATRDIILGDDDRGFVKLADVAWGGANLSTINWEAVSILGDEQEAYRSNTPYFKKPKTYRLKEFRAAVRANRQLGVVLQSQGLNESAERFFYRAHVLQLHVFLRQQQWAQAAFSAFLFLVTGYGYRLRRSFLTYLVVNVVFGLLYWKLAGVPINEAIFVSLAAFHGRGFQPNLYQPNQPGTFISGFEALVGLIVEAIFIATLTQRFFGK